MNFNSHSFSVILISTVILTVFMACDSPLGIDTPRKEYLDKTVEPSSVETCDPVFVEIPSDTGDIDNHFSAVLVFDGSESISPLLNQTMKNACHAFLDSLDGVYDEAAIVCFNSVVTVFQRITTNVPALREAVLLIPTVGATSMWDGIFTGLLELQARATRARKALLVITETRDNSSTTGTPVKIVALAKSLGVPIYTISMATSIDESKLAEIAMDSGGQHYRLPPLEQISTIYREIAHRLKTF